MSASSTTESSVGSRTEDSDLSSKLGLAADLVSDARHRREQDRKFKRIEVLLDPRFDKIEPVLRREDVEADYKKNAEVESAALKLALQTSASEAEESRVRSEEEQLAQVLALSQADPVALRDFDTDELSLALQASLESDPQPEYIDNDAPGILHAALQASRVDLGPRGPSVVAKIMSSGDATMGQQHLLKSSTGKQCSSTVNGRTSLLRSGSKGTTATRSSASPAVEQQRPKSSGSAVGVPPKSGARPPSRGAIRGSAAGSACTKPKSLSLQGNQRPPSRGGPLIAADTAVGSYKTRTLSGAGLAVAASSA